MKTSNDHLLLERSLEHSTQIFEFCKILPETEPSMIHLFKDSAIQQSAYLNQLIYSSSNEEQVFYLENARGYMYKLKTIFDLAFRLDYINSNDLTDFITQLDMMIEAVDKRVHYIEEELEKERANLNFCLPELQNVLRSGNTKRLDS